MSAGTFFKTFNSSDKTTTRTLLHEAIPITGSLLATGGGSTGDTSDRPASPYTISAQSDGTNRPQNVKTFSHAMFTSVYDYPHLSSSANHIFDITAGFNNHADSYYNEQLAADAALAAKKNNIYNQMAQVLSGYDVDGSVRPFDIDGDLSAGPHIQNAMFLNFSRLLVKDEIKKGSFSMQVSVNTTATERNDTDPGDFKTITDAGAATSYKINSPAGEYGILKSTSTGAVATVTITNHANLGTDDSVSFKTTSGATITATGHGSTTTTSDTDSPTFDTGDGSNNATATNLAACLNANSKISAVADGPKVTITQTTAGTLADKAVTIVAGGGAGMTKTDFVGDNASQSVGLVYYQAGIVVLNAGKAAGDLNSAFDHTATDWTSTGTNMELDHVFQTGTINAITDGLRERIQNISFNNTTELNSTIHFCRASHNEFNYSSNPTYLSGSSVRVKNNNVLAPPRSYVTTIGLYSADNELLATAKLSEPLRKDPSNELTLRVRLDY
jgi:hypothetical protein